MTLYEYIQYILLVLRPQVARMYSYTYQVCTHITRAQERLRGAASCERQVIGADRGAAPSRVALRAFGAGRGSRQGVGSFVYSTHGYLRRLSRGGGGGGGGGEVGPH